MVWKAQRRDSVYTVVVWRSRGAGGVAAVFLRGCDAVAEWSLCGSIIPHSRRTPSHITQVVLDRGSARLDASDLAVMPDTACWPLATAFVLRHFGGTLRLGCE